MGSPAFDHDRITVQSDESVGASSKTWTKPAGARAFEVECEEAYYLHGGDEVNIGGNLDGDTITPGATNRMPYAAGAKAGPFPCGTLATVEITAQTGSLTKARVIWYF